MVFLATERAMTTTTGFNCGCGRRSVGMKTVENRKGERREQVSSATQDVYARCPSREMCEVRDEETSEENMALK